MTRDVVVLPDVELQPGELYLSREPAILRTILGSCVGVTFWSPRLRAGALCHGVLPRCPPAPLSLADRQRYVDFSIRHLLEQFEMLNVSRKELVIKVFGGADVLPGGGATAKPTIGALNCAAAAEVLAEEGCTVTACDVGGKRGRRIHFQTGTGEVLLYRLAAWQDHAAGAARSRGKRERRCQQ
jgi:chemotaxis protein CheD